MQPTLELRAVTIALKSACHVAADKSGTQLSIKSHLAIESTCCDERRVSAGKFLNTGTIWGQMNDRSRALSESQLSRLATRIGQGLIDTGITRELNP